MLKNYFKLAYRNLFKTKISSLINIIGLSITIGCGILAYLYVHSELSRDAFHQHADNIFLIEHTIEGNNGTQYWGKSPAPLGPALLADHAQVKRAVRIAEGQVLVITDDFHFTEHVRFADSDFFSMFSFPMKYGDQNALEKSSSIVISAGTSQKYFGDENPVGKTLVLSINDQAHQAFTVAGVTEKFPVNTSLAFDILVPYSYLQSATKSNDWAQQVRATFIEVNKPADIQSLASEMGKYIAAQNAAVVDEHLITSFQFKNIKDLTLNSADVKNTIAYRVNWAPIVVLCTITAFLFLLSCFNYMNISLGAVQTRMREIGVRKVMGSNKIQLIAQFLTENVLLCLISLVFGVIVATAFLVPGFTYITNGLDLSFNFSERYDLWVFLLCLVISLGLISGAYPAFYISSFKPVAIFSGRLKTGGPNRFMQSLLGFQFVLALITMVLSVGLGLNNDYLRSVDWGYDKDNIFVINLGPESYELMYNAAQQLPGVTALAGARNHIGKNPLHSASFTVNNQSHEVIDFKVTDSYFDTIKPNLKLGVFPDAPDQILINEVMATTLGDTNPINKTVKIDSIDYNVAGVVQDFHFQNFSEPIAPAFIRTGNASDFIFLVMRIAPGTEKETIDHLASVWNSNFPDDDFSHFFQDTVFHRYHEESKRIMNIFYFAAIFALLLTCAGLFGLASQQISSRMKEMSIRKILGASVSQVIQLANKKFLLLLVIASVLAAPISYTILNLLLEQLAVYHMPMNATPFVIAMALVVGTAILTLSSQIYRLTTANPVDLLRDE